MPLSPNQELQIGRQVTEALDAARQSRYPVVVVLVRGDTADHQFWPTLAGSLGLTYQDLLDSLGSDAGLQKAAAIWPEAAEWLRRRCLEAGGVVFAEVDVLAVRWDDDSRRRFFVKLLKSQMRRAGATDSTPMVVITRLAAALELPGNPRETGRILDLTEH